MIKSYAYDVEILPNFFSITIIDLRDYLSKFADANDGSKKARPIPLIKKYSVAEITKKLSEVKKYRFYITDTDDSQLLQMSSFISNMRPHRDDTGKAIRTDMFGYNSTNYDSLMVAAFLMFVNQCSTTKELIKKLYDLSKNIIRLQDDRDLFNNDYFISTIKKFKLPYVDIDVMTIFALNKVGKGKDKNGNDIYFPKSLKQTSINLQWYELLEYELPPITEKDADLYRTNPLYKGIPANKLNSLIDKWDRYILDEWIPDTMHYNTNDVFIVCEMVRLYIDEIRLRYNISHSYEVNVLSASRSKIADTLFTKFYTEFSGLNEKQWRGRKTERTAMSFKRVIFPFIHFETKELQDMLNEMKKIVVYSVNKTSFQKEIKIHNLTYTIATGGLHSQDIPRELKSKLIYIDSPSTGEQRGEAEPDNIWDKITDNSYIFVHYDISSFYPSIMDIYRIAPEHINEGVFVKLIHWLKETRIQAKHSEDDYIDGIPKDVLAQVLKIVINSIYGKLGYAYGDLYDRLAVLKVTINGQLMILMLCERLEQAGIEVMSANTDGIVVKLYKRDKAKFDSITKEWMEETKLSADSEEYITYVNRDINNYFAQEFNGKITYKGALNPLMYAVDLQKGYDMPIVAEAVVNYFLYNKPILETFYEADNILDFCKSQNVGKQFHVEYVDGSETNVLQRYVRFYVANSGGSIRKVNNNTGRTGGEMAAGQKVKVLNTLDDKPIAYRDICYSYYYKEALKIIDPIKLSISPNSKGNSIKKTSSGKVNLKKYSGCYNKLFDDNEE